MRKFFIVVLFALLTASAANAASDLPNFSAKRFSAAIGIKHEWRNEFRTDGWEQNFEKVGWSAVMPVAYKLTTHTYISGAVEKDLQSQDWRGSIGFNWRLISGGKNTLK